VSLARLIESFPLSGAHLLQEPQVSHLLITASPLALSTTGLVSYLQGLFGPLFLGIVGIVAIFFLFTREIIRFVQFLVLAIAIAVVFYTPGIVQTIATGIAHALGVH
jgi:hypothetical protein